MTPPQILLLCSGRLAVPTVYRLANEQALLGLVVPDTDPKATQLLQELAFSLGCPFHLLNRQRYVSQLRELNTTHKPDAVFVIGFPWRIPESLLVLPPQGFFNFHGGLLPELRGPDPIFEAIRQELSETALTVHRMDTGWDTGPIVYEDRFPLTADLTHGLLSTQLAFRCEQAIPGLLRHLQQKSFPDRAQSGDSSQYWPRVRAVNLYIRWTSQKATTISALIRACNPVYGGAATLLNGWTLRLTDAIVLPGITHTAIPGTLLDLSAERGALIQCLDGAILQVFVIGTDEGYFPAFRLQGFGITAGIQFETLPSTATSSHLSSHTK